MIVLVVPSDIAFGVQIVTVDGQAQIQVLSRDDLYPMPRASSFPPRQGEWARTPDGQIVIVCARCEGMAQCAEPPHSIDDSDGAVNPSWVCPSGCGYHRWVRLDGWDCRPAHAKPRVMIEVNGQSTDSGDGRDQQQVRRDIEDALRRSLTPGST